MVVSDSVSMLFHAQHGGGRRGTGSCEEEKHISTINSRGFPVSLAEFIFIRQARYKWKLEPTRVVDWGHLNGAGGEGGLGLELVPFKCGYRSEEMVLVPSILLRRGRKSGGSNGFLCGIFKTPRLLVTEGIYHESIEKMQMYLTALSSNGTATAPRPQCSYFLIDGTQIPVLPQCVQHLRSCFNHFHGVPRKHTHTHKHVLLSITTL